MRGGGCGQPKLDRQSSSAQKILKEREREEVALLPSLGMRDDVNIRDSRELAEGASIGTAPGCWARRTAKIGKMR